MSFDAVFGPGRGSRRRRIQRDGSAGRRWHVNVWLPEILLDERPHRLGTFALNGGELITDQVVLTVGRHSYRLICVDRIGYDALSGPGGVRATAIRLRRWPDGTCTIYGEDAEGRPIFMSNWGGYPMG